MRSGPDVGEGRWRPLLGRGWAGGTVRIADDRPCATALEQCRFSRERIIRPQRDIAPRVFRNTRLMHRILALLMHSATGLPATHRKSPIPNPQSSIPLLIPRPLDPCLSVTPSLRLFVTSSPRLFSHQSCAATTTRQHRFDSRSKRRNTQLAHAVPGPALTARSASRGGRYHLGRGRHETGATRKRSNVRPRSWKGRPHNRAQQLTRTVY